MKGLIITGVILVALGVVVGVFQTSQSHLFGYFQTTSKPYQSYMVPVIVGGLVLIIVGVAFSGLRRNREGQLPEPTREPRSRRLEREEIDVLPEDDPMAADMLEAHIKRLSREEERLMGNLAALSRSPVADGIDGSIVGAERQGLQKKLLDVRMKKERLVFQRQSLDEEWLTGATEQAWLGVEVVEAFQFLTAFERGVPAKGLLIKRLWPNGPGAAAGLQVGDIIAGIDGKPPGNRSAFRSYLDKKHAGDSVVMRVVRKNGKTMDMRARLGVTDT